MKKILFILLALLALIGCKSKEKVTEQVTEIAHATSGTVQAASASADSRTQTTSTAQAMLTAWNDSVVEKTRELIVTDSSGRVLLHEEERTTEHYTGRGQTTATQLQGSQEERNATCQGTLSEANDSTYEGRGLREEVKEKPKSWRWLWSICILGALFVAGYTILRFIKR